MKEYKFKYDGNNWYNLNDETLRMDGRVYDTIYENESWGANSGMPITRQGLRTFAVSRKVGDEYQFIWGLLIGPVGTDNYTKVWVDENGCVQISSYWERGTFTFYAPQ